MVDYYSVVDSLGALLYLAPALGVSTGGNTAGNTGTTHGTIVLSGQANITLSQITGTNNVHTIGISAAAGGGGGDAIRGIAAGGSTASTNTVNFSNSNGVSFGFGAAGNSTVMTASIATSLTNVNLSAGTTSNNLSAMVFSNSNNVSFGLNGSTVTASASVANPASWFANLGGVSVNSSAIQISGSTSQVQPFYMPYDISVSYIRLPVTMSAVGSMAAVGTANNVTRGMTQSSTFNVVIYSQGVGASSRSLMSYASGSGSLVQRATVQAAGVGSNWSSGHTISFPREGGNTDFTTSGAATSASFTLQSTQLSDFTGLRFLDIPFATSMSAGNYWFCYGSSTSISTSGTANISTVRVIASNFCVSQPNNLFNLMGSVSNSSVQAQIGLGSWTTNAIATTSAIDMTGISARSSQPHLFFQMIRQA